MKRLFILSLALALVFPSLSLAVEQSVEEKSSELASIIESIKNLINSLKKDQVAAPIVISQNTFASKVNTELDVLVNGPGKGNFYIYENNANTLGGAFKANPNSWTNKLDFTGVMTWQNEWGDARKAGTLISPSFMVQADHKGYGFYPGRILRFADKLGNTEERTVVDYRVIPGTDLHITELDKPLPTDRFKVYKVFASLDEFTQKNSFDPIPVVGGLPAGETNNLKFLTVNQNRSVIVQQAQGSESGTQIDIWDPGVTGCPVRFGAFVNPNFEALRDGDSGAPGFVVVNGELILIEVHSGSMFCMGGPFISKYINEINSAMSDMGSTERLSTISLNSVGSFINVNHVPQFVKKNYKVQISEKSPVGTVVTKIEARDINPGQILTYSIIGGSGANYFAINSATGQITVKDSIGLDFNSPTLRSMAGISPTNDLAIPSLNLDIQITDNGSPSKSNFLKKIITSAESPVQIEILKQSVVAGTKSLAIDPLRVTQISATTPLNFVYKVSNWPVSSVNVSLVPFNASGIEIRGNAYPLASGSLINLPVLNSKRSGSVSYSEGISQATINAYESKARAFGSRMSGGLKLPIKYKVKICGAGIDATLCAISNESFSFLNPVVSILNPDQQPDPEPVSVNIAPVLQTIRSKTVAENNQLTFTISATDGDGDVLTYSATNLPSGATFAPSIRTFVFSPSFTQAGTYSPTFTVSDGKGGTDTETVSITVANTNRPPTIVSNSDQIITNSSSIDLPTNATREQLIAYLTVKIQELIAEYTRVKSLEDAQNGVTPSENVLKGFQFTKTFGVGTSDKEVRYLQRFLNTHGFSLGTGLGSYGKEVDTFGQVTQATLKRYQASQGIEATGYFGPITRSRVNETLLLE